MQTPERRIMEYERIRREIELAVLSFAHDYHRFENIRKDIAFKGIKSHPKFIDKILSLDGIEIKSDDQSLPSIIFPDGEPLYKQIRKAGFVKVIKKDNSEPPF
jgi:hypothetical protein